MVAADTDSCRYHPKRALNVFSTPGAEVRVAWGFKISIQDSYNSTEIRRQSSRQGSHPHALLVQVLKVEYFVLDFKESELRERFDEGKHFLSKEAERHVGKEQLGPWYILIVWVE